MALKVEELQVLINANAEPFYKELAKVNSNLKVLEKSVGKVSQGVGDDLFSSMVKANVLGQVISSTFGKVTSAIGSTVKEVITGGGALSRLAIVNEVVARNVGVTTEQMQELRDSLAEANTFGSQAENVIKSLVQSGLVQLADGLQAVDARTGKTVKGVSALTLAMKDLGASAGISSAEGIDRVTKFIQRGESAFVDGMIELGNLNKEYDDFAKSINKSRGDLTAQEEAIARMNIVMREGNKVWGSYAASLQSSGKIISDIPRVIKSTAEIVGSAIEPILATASSGIIQIFIGLRQGAEDNKNTMRDWANNIAGYIVAIIRALGSLLSRIPIIGKNFQSMANFTVKPIQSQTKLANAVNNSGNAMSDATKDASKLAKELKGLAGFDEMNVLNNDSGAGSSGSGGMGSVAPIGGGGGGSATLPGLDAKAINESADRVTKKIDDLKKKFKELIQPLKDFKPLGIPIVDILANIAKWAGILTLAFRVLWPIISSIVAVFAFFTSPIALVIGALSVLIGVGVLLYQNFEGFRNLIDNIVVFIQSAFVVAINALGMAWNWFLETILKPITAWIIKNILPTLIDIGDKLAQLAGVFKQRMPEIINVIKPLVSLVGEILSTAFATLGQIIDKVWNNVLKPVIDWLLAMAVPAFNFLISVLLVVINTFTAVASAIWTVLQPAMVLIWNVIKTVFSSILESANVLRNNLGVVIGWIANGFEFVIGNALRALRWVWDNILMPIFNSFAWAYNNLVAPTIDRIRNGFDILRNSFGAIRDDIWRIMDSLWEKVSGTFNRIGEVIRNAFSTLGNVGGNLWNAIKSTINDKLIRRFNEFQIKLDLGVKTIHQDLPDLPYLAKGGIVSSPTVAMIGEAGREAVVPLENNTQWINDLATKINGQTGGGNGQTLVVNLGDKKIFEQFIDYVNDRTASSNMQQIII